MCQIDNFNSEAIEKIDVTLEKEVMLLSASSFVLDTNPSTKFCMYFEGLFSLKVPQR